MTQPGELDNADGQVAAQVDPAQQVGESPHSASRGADKLKEGDDSRIHDAEPIREREATGKHINLFEAEEAMIKARAIKDRQKNDSRKVKLILGRDATDEELRRAERFEEGFR